MTRIAQQDRGQGLARGGFGRLGIGRDQVGRDRVLHVLRQVGVVGVAQVEVGDVVDRVGRAGAVRVDQIDVVEGRLRQVEGVLGDVFGLGVEIDAVGDGEGAAGLEARRFRARNARAGAELGRIFTVAADVEGAVDAGFADALTEVGETRGRAFEPVGLAGGHAEAVGAVGEAEGGAGAREAVFVGDVRIVELARLLDVGQGRLTPPRTIDAANAGEQAGVHDAVRAGVGRIRIDAEADRGVVQPVDVERGDFVDLFILAVDVEVQAVVEQIDAGEGRDAAVRFAILVDHAVVGVDLEALEIIAQDEVQHARDGVSAVDRGGAAGDDLDVLDQQARDGVDVDGQLPAARTHVTAAVDEGQGAVGAQAAKVRQRQAAVAEAAAGRVGRDDGVGQGGNGGEVVDDGRLTGRQQVLALDLDQRGRGVGRVATDARAGDDDFVEFGGVILGVGGAGRSIERLLGRRSLGPDGRGDGHHTCQHCGGQQSVTHNNHF